MTTKKSAPSGVQELTKAVDLVKPPLPLKVIITRPNWAIASVFLSSTAPYVQNRFSEKQKGAMEAKQREGSSQAKKRKAKGPKDFEEGYRGSMHLSEDGWHGIPATAFRQAMIDACRLVEFDMTRAKMTVFIVEDGLDAANKEPLVRITEGKPEMFIDRVKVGINSTDLVPRAMFKTWKAKLRVRWDRDVFTEVDMLNLLARAGSQIGVGAGRPFSKSSAGTGKGTFDISDSEIVG